MNHILKEKHGKRIAIIENEFGKLKSEAPHAHLLLYLNFSRFPICIQSRLAGEVGIDDGLVVTSNEEVIEMMNGCLCCTGE